MARNSAKSKGYRKTKAKKPFLTKGELIGAIIILVVFAIAMIVILNDDLLFYIFPDGNLAGRDVKDGQIVAYADKDVKTRFVKIGDAGELEGFTRTTSFSSANVPNNYTFTPDDEASEVTYVSLSGSALKASELPTTYRDTMGSLGTSVTFTDTVETTVQGHDAYVFSYTHEYYDSKIDAEASEETEGAEHDPNTFAQNISAYIDVDGAHTLCLHITCGFEDGDHYIPEDKVVEYLTSYTGCFTLVDTAA